MALPVELRRLVDDAKSQMDIIKVDYNNKLSEISNDFRSAQLHAAIMVFHDEVSVGGNMPQEIFASRTRAALADFERRLRQVALDFDIQSQSLTHINATARTDASSEINAYRTKLAADQSATAVTTIRMWVPRIDQLTREQQEYALPRVEAFSHGKVSLLQGPAGTGKSAMLVQRLTMMLGQGVTPVRLLTYNTYLRQYIASATGERNVPDDLVLTTPQFVLRLYLKLVDPKENTEDFSRERHLYRCERLLELRTDPGEDRSHTLVDEVQDLTPQEVKVIRNFSISIHAAGDSAQAIFVNRSAVTNLEAIWNPDFPVTVQGNHRTTKRIAQFASSFLSESSTMTAEEFVEQTKGRNFEPLVELYEVSSKRNLGQVLSQAVMSSLDNRMTNVGILVNDPASIADVSRLLSSVSIAHEQLIVARTGPEGRLWPTGTKPIVTSIHLAKGMEFEHVVLLLVPLLLNNRPLMFTGATRARSRLMLISKGTEITDQLKALIGVNFDDVEKIPPPALSSARR